MDGYMFAFGARANAQQLLIANRMTALADGRNTKPSTHLQPDGGKLERTATNTSTASGMRSVQHSRNNSNSYGAGGDLTHPPTTSSSTESKSESAHQRLLNNPYEVRHARRYLRELPYPLPVDLLEIQRQNLRTLLSIRVFHSAVCSPAVKENVPERVLEMGCGSGYWSASCHDYFSKRGHPNVSFTGLDVAPLAPDLTRQGVKWTFVQHDMRRVPLPFDDEQFDLVMLKDVSLVLPVGAPSQKLVEESIRILRPGGTLEIWESDHVIRSLLPHPSILSRQYPDQKHAINTATFLITPATPFASSQNRYFQESNEWIQEALDKRQLPSTPCAGVADMLHQEPDSLGNVGSRRIAIPFGELRWERDVSRHSQFSGEKLKGKDKAVDKMPTEHQADYRHIALLTVVQMVESFEPLLKEVSGKNSEEWAGWWAAMMNQLFDQSKSALNGECLEIGAWWATKIRKS